MYDVELACEKIKKFLATLKIGKHTRSESDCQTNVEDTNDLC